LPSLGQKTFYFTAAMEHGKDSHFVNFNDIINSVWKATEIQSASAMKTDRVKQRALAEFSVRAKKLIPKFAAQSGLFILIPIVGDLQISPD
jgi:hypothetical protein